MGHEMDIEQIRMLTDLMVERDLTEIRWQNGETRVLIRRASLSSPPEVLVSRAAPARPTVDATASTAVVHQGVSASAPPASVESAGGTFIRSPMVGTFYATPDPESPPFVSIGSRVEPDTVVCMIEAMKVFNEIKAEVSGSIEAVLVENGQPVEYGKPLFRVSPNPAGP
jgi:acetyl-CoA carboxylase biotin carboxyl carrier protein